MNQEISIKHVPRNDGQIEIVSYPIETVHGQKFIAHGPDEYGMQVRGGNQYPEGVSAASTGSFVVFEDDEIHLYGLVDGLANVYYTKNTRRLLGRITGLDLRHARIDYVSSGECIIKIKQAKFSIEPDGVMTIEAKRECTYWLDCLIDKPEWYKSYGPFKDWRDQSNYLLHYPGDNTTDDDFKCFKSPSDSRVGCTLRPGQRVLFAVGPPKLFDFERLYTGSPRLYFSLSSDPAGVDRDIAMLPELEGNRVGTVVIFHGHYNGLLKGAQPLGFDNGAPAYYMTRPTETQRLIRAAKVEGMNIALYFQGKHYAHLPATEILSYIELFLAEHDADTLYLDNAIVGPVDKNRALMRGIRKLIGDDMPLISHSTASAPGNLNGMLCLPDIWASHTIAGELADAISTIDDPYLRFKSSGFGNTQAMGHHKCGKDGLSGIDILDGSRVMAGLHGLSRMRSSDIGKDYWDDLLVDWWYRYQRGVYLSDPATFKAEPNWPPDWEA